MRPSALSILCWIQAKASPARAADGSVRSDGSRFFAGRLSPKMRDDLVSGLLDDALTHRSELGRKTFFHWSEGEFCCTITVDDQSPRITYEKAFDPAV